MEPAVRVTVWNEGRHERQDPRIAAIYPGGLHAAIADGLREHGLASVRTATLDDPQHGLSESVLAERMCSPGGATRRMMRSATTSSSGSTSACSTAWA